MTDHDSAIEALLEQRQEQGYGTPSETITKALSRIVIDQSNLSVRLSWSREFAASDHRQREVTS